MPLEIRYLPAAQEDLLSIVDWISQDAPLRAEAWQEKLDQRIQILAETPSIGRVPRNEQLQNAGYRILTLDDYLVFYVPLVTEIVVHRVLHGSRNLDAII